MLRTLFWCTKYYFSVKKGGIERSFRDTFGKCPPMGWSDVKTSSMIFTKVLKTHLELKAPLLQQNMYVYTIPR